MEAPLACKLKALPFFIIYKVCKEEEGSVAEKGGEDIGLPFQCGEREGGYGVGDAVHGGGCPVEQVGEEGVDRVAPEECPPKDAYSHEEIDKEEEYEVAEEGYKGETPEIVCHQGCCENRTDEGDGDDGDEPHEVDEPVGCGA